MTFCAPSSSSKLGLGLRLVLRLRLGLGLSLHYRIHLWLGFKAGLGLDGYLLVPFHVLVKQVCGRPCEQKARRPICCPSPSGFIKGLSLKLPHAEWSKLSEPEGQLVRPLSSDHDIGHRSAFLEDVMPRRDAP